LDAGFELGGPIVRDRVWFFVGFAPIFSRQTIRRVVSTQVDRRVNFQDYADANCAKNFDGTCDGDRNPATSSKAGCETTGSCEADGLPDLDPATGFTEFDEVDRQSFTRRDASYQFTAKVNFAVSPEHQGQVSLTGTPVVTTDRVLSVAGTPTAGSIDEDLLTTD